MPKTKTAVGAACPLSPLERLHRQLRNVVRATGEAVSSRRPYYWSKRKSIKHRIDWWENSYIQVLHQ